MTRANSDVFVSANSSVAVLPIAMAALWSRTSLIREFWDIVQAVGGWQGASIIEHRSGLALSVNDVVLGHLKWGGELVLAFGVDARAAIADEMDGYDKPPRCDGDVIVFNIRRAIDVDRALCLLRFSYLISDFDRGEVRASRAADTSISPTPSFDGGVRTPFEI